MVRARFCRYVPNMKKIDEVARRLLRAVVRKRPKEKGGGTGISARTASVAGSRRGLFTREGTSTGQKEPASDKGPTQVTDRQTDAAKCDVGRTTASVVLNYANRRRITRNARNIARRRFGLWPPCGLFLSQH